MCVRFNYLVLVFQQAVAALEEITVTKEVTKKDTMVGTKEGTIQVTAMGDMVAITVDMDDDLSDCFIWKIEK